MELSHASAASRTDRGGGSPPGIWPLAEGAPSLASLLGERGHRLVGVIRAGPVLLGALVGGPMDPGWLGGESDPDPSEVPWVGEFKPGAMEDVREREVRSESDEPGLETGPVLAPKDGLELRDEGGDACSTASPAARVSLSIPRGAST